MNDNDNIKLVFGGMAVVLILIFVIAFFPIVVVGAGERGVVFNNISGLEDRILGEGTHTRIPFVESVITMPIRTQATKFQENAGTSDSQTINLNVTVNWHLDPAKVNKIYQSIGNDDSVVSKVLTPNTQDAVKAATSKYVALDIQRNRDNVSTRALELLQTKVKRYDVVIDSLSITNINFGSEFNAAIEQAQVAQQNAKRAEYDVVRVQNEAKSAIAKATGEAEAQRLQQQSLTPELLQKMAIEKWKGEFPTYYGGGVLPFLNLPSGH
jgi:prohibitin 1